MSHLFRHVPIVPLRLLQKLYFDRGLLSLRFFKLSNKVFYGSDQVDFFSSLTWPSIACLQVALLASSPLSGCEILLWVAEGNLKPATPKEEDQAKQEHERPEMKCREKGFYLLPDFFSASQETFNHTVISSGHYNFFATIFTHEKLVVRAKIYFT